MQANGWIDEKLLEESLEELYENAPCGYVSTLPDGAFVKVNRTFLTWIGYSREELLSGKRLQDLLSIEGKIYHETHFAPLLAMQGFVNEVAFNLRCRNGRTLPVLVNSIQKRDDAGEPLFNRTTIFNATDRREYERELLLARRRAEGATEAKTRFLSMFSHEIRNPLGSISMAIELLESIGYTDEQEPCVRILKSSANSLMDLVNQILSYNRIESGQVELDERLFDLRNLVKDVIFRTSAKAVDKKIAVRSEIDAQVPSALLGDPIKIGQILTNLVGNAVKFTEKGSITVRVNLLEIQEAQCCLKLSVEDTGIGIEPDRLSSIFEEFVQASRDTSFRYGGTGLGLAICQKLLRLYNSQLSVESTVGQGSTFAFELCLKVAEPEESLG